MNKQMKKYRFLAGFLLLTLIFLPRSLPAYAGNADNVKIVMRDENGNDITSRNSYYEALGEVSFDISLRVDECDMLAYTISKDEGESYSTYIPIEDERLVFYPEKAERLRIRFYLICEKTRDAVSLLNNGEYYGISFGEGLAKPRASINGNLYQNINNEYYFNGDAPVIKALSAFCDTYIEIRGVDTKAYECRKIVGSYEMELAEGVYDAAVFCVDDSKRIYAQGFPKRVIYDCSPPFDLEFETNYPEKGYYDDAHEGINLFSNDDVVVHAKGHDSISGIESVIIDADNKKSNSDEIIIKSGRCDNIRAYCIDRCGNKSSIYECDLSILVDREPPKADISGDKEHFSVAVYDEKSPLKSCRIKYNGQVIKEEVYTQENRDRYERSMELYLNSKKEEEGVLEICAADLSGNEYCEKVSVKTLKNQPPRIIISGINNLAVTKDHVNIKVEVYDRDLDDKSVLINAVNDSTGKRYSFKEGDAIVFQDDGAYEFFVSASDTEGNMTSVSENFVIDSIAPLVPGLEKYKGAIVDSFCLKDEMRDMFQDDTIVQYQIYVNGKLFSEADSVVTPGCYKVEIAAVDQAGNISSDFAEFTIRDKNVKAEAIETNYMNSEPNGEKVENKDTFSQSEDDRVKNIDCSQTGINNIQLALCAAVCIITVICVIILARKKKRKPADIA